MNIYFAPLQGYTTALYRQLHHSMWGNVASYYTPFVRLEKGDLRKRDLLDIAPANNSSTPVIPQMLPRDADELRRISKLFIDNGYTHADINMGCPFPPVALHRRGSGILMYPDAVAELMRTIEEFPELSYSVKMRLGWQQNDEWKGVIEILNNASLSHICLHARIGKQQYKGDIDLDAFTAFYANCKHPIIFNGDITTVNDIQQIRIKFPALKGIMIGRGLLARPYLSTIVDNPRGYTTGEIIEKLQLFHNQLYEGFKLSSQGDAQLVQRAKSQWEYFLPHAPRKERKAIVKSTTPQRYEQAVANLFEALHRDVNSFEL